MTTVTEPLDVSADPLLSEIADLTDLLNGVPQLHERRKRLIREARAGGYSNRQLQAAAKVSEQRLFQILQLGARKNPGTEEDPDGDSDGGSP